jgi:hypothetical protein
MPCQFCEKYRQEASLFCCHCGSKLSEFTVQKIYPPTAKTFNNEPCYSLINQSTELPLQSNVSTQVSFQTNIINQTNIFKLGPVDKAMSLMNLIDSQNYVIVFDASRLMEDYRSEVPSLKSWCNNKNFQILFVTTDYKANSFSGFRMSQFMYEIGFTNNPIRVFYYNTFSNKIEERTYN